MDDQTQVLILLGTLVEKVENVEKAVLGNGQPGLAQKVEALESKQNKVLGGVAVLGTLGAGFWGFLEWLFHAKGAH